MKSQAEQSAVNQEPARGDDPLDITAVMSTQMTWDLENRTFRPNILKLWHRPTPWNNPTYEIGVMRYKGHVVLDTTGMPVRNFRIPLTISSKVEGLRIEAWMRSDDRLTLGDIEARLWTKDGPDGGRMPCFNRRALSKRASLARCRAGIISWLLKKGRDDQTSFMDRLRTPEQRARNLATGRDLNTTQLGTYAGLGLDESKQSNAPTREGRIRKIKKAAAGSDTVAGSSLGAGNAGSADPAAAASSDDDHLMAIDSDDDEAVPETRPHQQASEDQSDDEASVSSSLIDPSDSRHDQPADPQEEDLLRRALDITVEDFIFLTGQQPVLTRPGDNYFSQWGMLQEQLRALWEARGNPTAAPRLRARDRWTGGISQFEFAEIEEGAWGDE